MRRSLVPAILLVTIVVAFSTCSRDRAPLFDPGQPPPPPPSTAGIEVGPIDGLTSAWHPVPSHFAVPAGTEVELRCHASADDRVDWIGATEVERRDGWSVAVCGTAENQAYQVSVTVVPVARDQKDRDPNGESSPREPASPASHSYRCSFEAVNASAARVEIKDFVLSREPLFVTDKSSNWEVMRQYTGGSIARVTRIDAGHYRTAVATPILLVCKVEPPALGALAEWRVDGTPFALGQIAYIPLHLAIGDHEISVGPPLRPASRVLSLYRVVAIRSSANSDNITAEQPITYTAETDPAGFEAEVTWLAATRFGKAAPVLGRGATFTVKFEDVIGIDPNGAASHWEGVRADNATAAFDASPGAPPITISYPAASAVINNGTWIVVEQPGTLSLSNVTAMTWEYSSNGGGSYSPIAGPGEFDGWHTRLWNTRQLASGSYLIRVTMASVYGTASTTRSVTVNTQPTSGASVQSGGGLTVNLNGAPSFDPDGSITQYTWRFSDGGTATGQTAQHTFPSSGTHYMSLTVTDNRGGIDAAHYKVDIQPPAIFQVTIKQHCGCDNMTVLAGGFVTGPAGFSFAPAPASGIAEGAPQGTLGPYYDLSADNTLELADQPWNVKYRFEVVATLNPGSDPGLCAEGQRVKRTAKFGGNTYPKTGPLSRGAGATSPGYDPVNGPDNPYDPADGTGAVESGTSSYEDADPLQWCDDDYHGGIFADGSGGPMVGSPPNGFKAYDDQSRIVWLDAPGLSGLTAAQLPASYLAKFHGMVSGDTGTCDCAWSVLITIDVNRVVTANLVGLNCN